MRFAVPMSNGMVATHFGHCEHFGLFDVDEARMEILRREVVTSPGHEPGLLPVWLAEQGVSVIIASGMGSRAQNLFGENRITVATNVLEGDPEKAILRYLRGTLEVGDDVCDH